MAGSAAALAGGALLAVYGMDKAHTTPESPTDVDMLNYALTLEHLEANFHVQGLRRFGEQDFRSSSLFRGSSNLPRPTVYANFKRIRDHEVEHVKTLKAVIRSLGGTPVPSVPLQPQQDRLYQRREVHRRRAVPREHGGVRIRRHNSPRRGGATLDGGATIATVEARHASYLNLLNGDVPFPSAFDEPVAPGRFATRSRPRYANLDALCARLPNNVTS